MSQTNLIRVSIIIPCTDSPIIHNVLAALQSQIREDGCTEILVIGSDRRKLVRAEGSFRFIPTGTKITCASDKRNLGMQISRGEYVLFLDDDCIPDPGWLRGLLTHLQDGKPVVGGSVRFAKRNYLQMADNLSAFHDVLPYTPAGYRSYLMTANLGIHRTVIDLVGKMPPGKNRADDLEWTQQMRMQGLKLYFEPRASIFHDPSRRDIASVWKHWTGDAPHTLEVLLRYPSTLNTPRLASQRILYLWGAPLVAAWATARTYSHWRSWYHFAHAIPAVYLTKLAWCWSAYLHFRPTDIQETT